MSKDEIKEYQSNRRDILKKATLFGLGTAMGSPLSIERLMKEAIA